jgi:hypothetical protein
MLLSEVEGVVASRTRLRDNHACDNEVAMYYHQEKYLPPI